MFVRLDDSLGQGEILAFVAPLVGAAIQAGGAVGASLITADAVKYQAKQAAQTQRMLALSQEKIALEQVKAELESTKLTQAGETERTQAVAGTVTSSVGPVVLTVTVLGLAAIAVYVMVKE